MCESDADDDGTSRDRQPKEMTIYQLKRKNIPVMLKTMKRLLKEPKPKVQLYAKSDRAHREAIKKKCDLDAVKFASSESGSMQPQLAPYILMQYRKCLLRHRWDQAKRLLLAFLCQNVHHRVSWTSCVTALVHFPGAESVLREFIEMNKGTYNGDDLLRGLLTIDGLQAYVPARQEDDDSEAEDDDDGSDDTTDSEVVDDVEALQRITEEDSDGLPG